MFPYGSYSKKSLNISIVNEDHSVEEVWQKIFQDLANCSMWS